MAIILEQKIVLSKTSPHIKRKMNLRKRLIIHMKRTNDITLKARIKNLNYEIKQHFTLQKRLKVRKGIVPGKMTEIIMYKQMISLVQPWWLGS